MTSVSSSVRIVIFLFSAFMVTSCGVIRTSAPTNVPDVSPLSTGELEDMREIQSGTASWYGPNFHGKLTANGETFNMNDLTAAHRTLPFNTIVQVENLTNGRSVVVRINDRGPYVGDRVIDLSRRAAQEIDMENSGTASVRIYLLQEGDRPVTAQNASSRETFTVQLASFSNETEARAFSERVNGARVERVTIAGETVYRVYYGRFDQADDAREAQVRLEAQGFEGFVKQAEN